MPKKPKTPQITTPTSRKFKEAWEKECLRLKFAIEGITYPGDVQKSLIALLLGELDLAKRAFAKVNELLIFNVHQPQDSIWRLLASNR